MTVSSIKVLRRLAGSNFVVVLIVMASSFLCSCGSLEQWSQGLQAVGNSLAGVTHTPRPTNNVYNATYSTTPYYTTTPTTTTVSAPQKEWHNCSQCSGGKCKHCGGTGKNEYAKNGRCGVCRGTGKCAGCNGKGGWYI